MANATSIVEKPQAGQSVPVSLTEGQTTMSWNSGDVQTMELMDGGKLLIKFTDGASVIINNFQELALQGSVLRLADGTIVNTVELLSSLSLNVPANDVAEILVGQPAAGQTVEIELEAGQKYNFSFNETAKESVTQEAGALIISFDDGGKLVLKNFSDALDAADPVQISVGGDVISLGEFADFLKLADAMNDKMDGEKPAMAELRQEAGDVSKVEPAAGEGEQAPKGDKESMLNVGEVGNEDMAAIAEKLAGVEPAAGGQAGGGGSARAGGFGFQSVVDSADINPLRAIGPIGPTALQFGLPQPQEPIFIEEDPAAVAIAPPTVSANAGVDDAIVKEDGSVFVPITAAIGSGGDGDEILTLTVTGIDPTWGITFTDGSYDPATGTWTITLPPGTNYNGGLTFAPPADTDGDMPGLNATVTVFDPDTGTSQNASDTFNVITDAVADVPTVTADDKSGAKNTALAVDITGAVTDLDGSETITHYQVTGVPAGFAFNQGAYNPTTNVWTFTPAQLTGLTMTSPLNYHGSINLIATAFSGETTLGGAEKDFTDNTNSASDPFKLTWTPKLNPPDITLDNKLDLVNAQVKEDGSVDVPLKAVLGAGAEPTEYLTVTVTGISSAWGFSAPVGIYNAAAGTWTITLAPGQNLNTLMTFTPPANSDIDLSGLNATAVVTQPSSGLTASDSDAFGIIVDAVADKPTIDAANGGVNEGQPIAVNIAAALTDLDGSEVISGYSVSGVPTGFTFNQGTNAGGGVWTFTPAQLAGLTLTPTANYNGTLNLTATVYNTENPVSDGEFDSADNNNQASDQFSLTWAPTIDTPDVTVNKNVDDALVKEDGSIGVPITATLGANPSATEYLTVTVTGINSSWGFSAPVGTYNAATGTWTVTLAPGQNLNTVMTFTPPANSDLDLNGLNATVVARDPSSGLSASDSDAFRIIVDAVADKPTLTVSAPATEQGHNVPVSIGAAVTDTDGSETITHYQILNVPAGFSFNQGTNAGGVWTFTPAQIAGLQLVPPANYVGNVTMTVKVYNAETNLGGTEVDLTDNTNFAEKTLTVTLTRDDVPVLVQPETVTVDETNLAATGTTSVSDKVEANFFSDAPGSFAANGGFFAGIPLTSNGVAVTVSNVGNVYTAKAGAETIFTLTLQANGNYTFNLTGTLDHPNKADHNDNITLQFGVRATDSDGDSVDGVINVNVLDDGVNAHDDFASVPTSVGHVDGNVLPNDYRGQDTPSTVTKVQFGSTVVDVPATGTVTIQGDHGVLKLAADGSYTYTLNGSTAGIGLTPKEFATTNVYPNQPEGTALDPAGNFYGIKAGDLTVSDPTTGTITMRSEGAGYSNTVGMFVYNADGTISSADILIQNGNNTSSFGTPYNFSVVAGQTVGFFLIADGYTTNSSYAGIDLNTGTLTLV